MLLPSSRNCQSSPFFILFLIKDFLELFWKVRLTFYKVLVSIQQYVGTVKRTSSDNKIILLVNKADKGIVKQGSSLDIQIGGHYTGSTEPTATADIVDLSFDSQVVPTVVDG